MGRRRQRSGERRCNCKGKRLFANGGKPSATSAASDATNRRAFSCCPSPLRLAGALQISLRYDCECRTEKSKVLHFTGTAKNLNRSSVVRADRKDARRWDAVRKSRVARRCYDGSSMLKDRCPPGPHRHCQLLRRCGGQERMSASGSLRFLQRRSQSV